MKNSGFTAIEMIVVIGIFTMSMITATASIVYFYRSNSYSVEQTTAITSGRRGIEYFVKDAREATYAEDGAYPIVSMGTSSMIFYADVDAQSDVEKVRYFLDQGFLKKGVSKATGTPLSYASSTEAIELVSDYVRNLEKGVNIFTYKNASSTEITIATSTQSLRTVDMTLIVNVNPNRLPEEFTLRGSASLRNLKDL
jgi:type II secretory pathway pseudopilin PulG